MYPYGLYVHTRRGHWFFYEMTLSHFATFIRELHEADPHWNGAVDGHYSLFIESEEIRLLGLDIRAINVSPPIPVLRPQDNHGPVVP